eukprot:Em0021g942a
MEFTEEIEALQFTFPGDITWDQTEGEVLVRFTSDGHKLLTLHLTRSYPSAPPNIIVHECPDAAGIQRRLERYAEEQVGSPMLYGIVGILKEHVTACGTDEELPAEELARDKGPSRGSSANKDRSTICKYYLQGKCKFGDKCLQQHASKHKPQITVVDEGSDKKGTARKEPKSNDSLHPTADEKPKKQKKSPNVSSEDEDSTKKTPMRQAVDVISRILWDPDLPAKDFAVGYLDRFLGILEKPFSDFSWEDIASVGNNVLAVPQHRIQYFKYKNTIVWDKRCQLDDFFGSRGGKLISDFVDKTAVNAKQVEQVEPQESKAVASSQKEEGQAFLDEEEEPEEDDVSSAGAVDNKDRPNHFVCLHITSMEVKGMVEEIQTSICGHTPQLAEGCLPIDALHVTLCMLRLNSEQDRATAQAVLSDARTQFIHILPPCLQLTFRGVDNFRGRLVYVRVEPEPALERFVSYLLEQFQQAGLGTPGNHDQFTPHMTILKLTRPMARKLHTHAISPASYLAYRESPVGQHTVDNLQLCSMTAGKQGDGFYLRLETISNSLCGLPLFSTVLINHLNMLALQGIVTGAERDKLTHKVLQGGVHFEVAVEDIRQLCCQESARGLCTVPGQPIVVIMRGVPGSGKSHLVNSCKEMLTDPSSVAVCSADQYFSEAPGGYKFATHLLPKAHAHCLGRFVHALTEGKRLLVVDNTNSKLWEYRVYVFICEVLGLKCHVLEIPCEHPSITNMFCSRNVHGVDSAIVNRLVQRWEKDSNATYVPPSLILPRPSPAQPELFSLLSLCDPDSSVGTLDPVVPIYTGIFLSVEAQWSLLSSFPPTHPHIYADHVTLHFEPSVKDLLECGVGRQVMVKVTGKVDNGKVQAVTVELPRGVSCGNRFPHITISTNEGVLPKEANTVLEAQPAQPFSACVPLGGVVGVMVSGEGGGEGSVDPMGRFENKTTPPSFLVTSEADLHQFVLPRLKQKEVSQEDMEAILAARVSACEICTGTLPITQLFVFDFDGTLFNTPNPLEGRVMYEQLTGKPWPHRGWLGWPDSLLPPLKSTPLPAVAEFRRHLNIAGSFTILMTGRAQRIARAVKLILDNAHLVPQRYVFKPNISLKSTSAYKSRVIQELLEEFPQVTVVKIWDDDEDNLSAFHQVAKSCSRDIQFDIIDATRTPALQEGRSSSKATRVPTPSALKKYLMSYGYIPSPVHSVAATSGVRFLAERHASAIGFHGDPLLLAYEFGSHLLGRDGDVDMCLLVPPSFTVDAAMERMEASLRSCGVTHVHAGHSSRCPRLKTMLCFPTTSSINYDIVFAVVAMDTFFSAPPPTQLPVSEVLGYIKAGDSASKAALNGPVFLQHVDTIISGVLTRQQFGLVVEAVVQLLSANGQKGNSYHCIRTFHVVQLLADFVKAQKAMPTADFTPDHLFKEFVTHVALLAPDKWAKLFGEFVPQEFIPRVTKIFSKASQHVSVEDYPSITVFEDMMSHAQFPPEGYTTVDLILSGTDDSQLWKLHTLIESRLPTYIRQLLRCGLDVTPDGHVRNERKFSFAVPNSKQTKDTLQQVLRPLWNELADYRKNKSASVELTFGMAVQGAEGKGDLEEQVAQFARTTTSTELHLPPSLSSYERLKVHEAAEQLGLVHCTVGNGKSKHIVIKKR